MNTPDFVFAHLGINHDSSSEASGVAEIFQRLFGFSKREGNSSIFSGSNLELTKSSFPGEKGHIGIGTSDIDTSVGWLAHQGINIIAGSEKYKDDRLVAVYLDLTVS
ncbi:MAG: hypothetical protein DRP60_17115, partial [Spirochaetes bacterium]